MQQFLSLFSVARMGAFWRGSRRLRYGAGLFLVVMIVMILVVSRPPSAFPTKQLLPVEKGATITEVGEYLKQKEAITSPLAFTLLVRLFNPKGGVLSGSYYFNKPLNLISLSHRFAKGTFGLTPLTFTVPEGSTVAQTADIAARTFPNFDRAAFIALARSKEGYLFPDTYHLLPTISPAELLEVMTSNFNKRIMSIQLEIQAYGHSVDEVVKVASYLEEEARRMETRRMIAGILWKRLELGMPLQIDSSFQYVNGKNTFQLTTGDLLVDSPYNTYTHVGLTPTPLSSPGLDAIRAAITPTQSLYLFFLSDRNGVMHYAVTHEEHVKNKERYLR
jgi:UPF0755 protein